MSRQGWQTGWGLLSLRRDDVWLASFPRSGNSWFRAILANVLTLMEGEGQEVDWVSLRDFLPVLGASDLHEPWSWQSLPRFVKTHRTYIPILFSRPERVVCLVRDPRDVMVSYYDLACKSKGIGYAASFSDFIRHPRYGLTACIGHYRSWQPHATIVVRYERLRSETVRTMSEVFDVLDTPIPNDILTAAVERASIERMRKKEEVSGVRNPDRYWSDFRTVRSGESGQWRTHFTNEDETFYAALCEQFAYGLYPA